MKADLYPYLTDVERDMDSFLPKEEYFLWNIGDERREQQISDIIIDFNNKLKDATIYDLDVYTEGLKSHVARALLFYLDAPLSDYEKVIIYCHQNLSFAFLALIVRAYHIKQQPFNVSSYAKSAGISDISALFSAVCEAANEWGIHYTIPIRDLLSLTEQATPKDVILNNSTAISLMDKMREVGLLDGSYQWRTISDGRPQKHTNYEKAVYAYFIYNRCYPTIKDWDLAFCDLWRLAHRTLSKSLNELNNYPERREKYNALLSVFDDNTQ